MKSITLQPFGELKCQRPPLSICFDVVSMFSESTERHVRARICAVAVCYAVSDNRFPKKATSFDLIDFGSKCLDFLLSNGVPVAVMYEIGLELIGSFAESLPSEQGVTDVENFSG